MLTKGLRVGRGAMAAVALSIAAGLAAIAMASLPASAAGDYWELPRATFDPPSRSTRETVVLAGGCFWGVQAVYQRIQGVETAISGYAGGTAETARYSLVARGLTDHAEAVELVYNPQVISLGEILRIFFSVVHDPTQLDRQHSDIGPQYRSHIYYTSAEQRQVAEAYIAQLGGAGIHGAPIVTRLDPLDAFYPAEGYHQDYLVNNGRGDPNGPNIAYLRFWDVPKIERTERLFPEYWRSEPVTVAATRPDLI
jgi:peptide-methionine (S)-S-oxide reductase